MVYIFKTMTDEQIANRLLEKKQQFVEDCRQLVLTDEWDSQSEMAFQHICTVLEHAAKLIKTPIENILQRDTDIS